MEQHKGASCIDTSRDGELDHGYAVVGEILEYFDGCTLATWAPLAAIVVRERKAAMQAERDRCEALAIQWRDENRAAAAKARTRDSRAAKLGFEPMGFADQLDGAAMECNAIAGAIRDDAPNASPKATAAGGNGA